jgi:hypothetical protein
MDILRAAALIAATITMGVMAGVFQLYAYAIMPGLARTNDRTFVGAFQAIDTAIINPLFMGNFFGALVFTGLAALLHIGADERSVLQWAARGAGHVRRSGCQHNRDQRATERRDQGSGRPRPHRCRRRPWQVRRSQVDSLEPAARRPHYCCSGLLGLGPCVVRPPLAGAES